MDSIPPDVAKKLLNRDFANLAQRVQPGGEISRTERAMLQTMAAGAGGDGPAFVRNFVELATALKVTRQTINGWKKFEDAPKPAPNGLRDVALWRERTARQRPPTTAERIPRSRRSGNSCVSAGSRAARKRQTFSRRSRPANFSPGSRSASCDWR